MLYTDNVSLLGQVLRNPRFYLFLLLTIIATIISAYLSPDSIHYQGSLSYHSAQSWADFFVEMKSFEAFYLTLAKLYKGQPSYLWFATIALFSVSLKLLLIQQASRHFYLSLMAYLCCFYVLLDGTVIRASLAIVIAYWGAWFLSKHRYPLAVFLIFIAATCFHYSLVFFFLVLLFNSKRLSLFLIVLYPLLILFWFFDYSVLGSLFSFLTSLNDGIPGVEKLQGYLLIEDEHAAPYSLQFIVLYLLSVLVYWRYRGEVQTFEQISFNCVFMSLVVLAIFVGAQDIQIRVSEIYRFGFVFVFPFYYNFLSEWIKPLWLVNLIFCLALLFYFNYYVMQAGLITLPRDWGCFI